MVKVYASDLTQRIYNTRLKLLGLFGVGPDAFEARARTAGAAALAPVEDRGHGWREVMIEDPDGYVWAVGHPTAE